jgi:hypothetical protein
MLRIKQGAGLASVPVLGLVLMFVPGLQPAAQAGGFGGRAFNAFVNAPTLGVAPAYIGDTGALPSRGGWECSGLPDTEIGALLAAQTLIASTSGGAYSSGGQLASTATSLAGLVLFPGNLAEVTASFVRAQAAATLGGLSGTSEIDQLTFGGMPVQVTGLPNQRIVIPGVATLVINEQAITIGLTSRGITVNALHLKLATGEEVIVSSATSSVSY